MNDVAAQVFGHGADMIVSLYLLSQVLSVSLRDDLRAKEDGIHQY